MVIPIGAPLTLGIGSTGDLDENSRRSLARVKYCVLGLWAGGLMRLLLGDPISAISTLLDASFGSFLLAEDPHLMCCYRILRDSLVGQCCGVPGIPMLPPFILFSAVNCIFDALLVSKDFSKHGLRARGVTNPLVDVTIAVLICETLATIFAWSALKSIAATATLSDEAYYALSRGDPPRQVAMQGLLGPGARGQQRWPAEPEERGPRSQLGPQAGAPFSGQGFRLGG